MKMLKDVLTQIDIYGGLYTFRINNNSKFKTEVGGFFSLITLGAFIFCAIYLGDNFYYRHTSTSTYETGIYADADVPVLNYQTTNETNYLFIMNFNPIHPLLKIQLMNEYASGTKSGMFRSISAEKFTNLTGLAYELTTHSISYIDLSSYNLGLNIRGESNYGKLNIGVTPCLLGDTKLFTQEELSLCTTEKVNSIKNLFRTTMLYIMVVRVGFDKNNLASPIIKKFKRYSFLLEQTSVLNLNIVYIQNKLESDEGWLSPSYTNYTSLSVKEITYQSTTQTQRNTDSSIFPYSISIALSDEFIKYTRTYIKFQDFLAVILSVMKIVLLISEYINIIIRSYRLDMFIADKHFAYENTDTPHQDSGLNKIQIDDNGTRKQEKEKSETKVNNFIRDSKGKEKKKFNTSIDDSRESDKDDENSQNNQTNNAINLEKRKVSSDDIKGKDKVNLAKNTNFFSYFSAQIVNLCCSDKKTSDNNIDLKACLDITSKIMDVDYLFTKIYEIEVLKRLFLNESQIMALGSLQKIQLKELKEEMENSKPSSCSFVFSDLIKNPEEKQEMLISYFSRKRKEDSFDSSDTFLYSQLDKQLKEKIEEGSISIKQKDKQIN